MFSDARLYLDVALALGGKVVAPPGGRMDGWVGGSEDKRHGLFYKPFGVKLLTRPWTYNGVYNGPRIAEIGSSV